MPISSLSLAPTNFRAITPQPAVVAPSIESVRGARHSTASSPHPEAAMLPTFNEVIVPLDGSPHAEHALPWAIQIASLAGARLRLVHVHLQMQPSFHGRRLQLYREFDRLRREPMDTYMSNVVRRVARVTSASVSPMVVSAREVADALSHLAAAGADLMVMATRGRTTFGRMLRGSALDALVHRSSLPLLHVRGYSCPVDLTARPSLQHALVGLDGSSESTDVLRPVAALGKLTEGSQTLLRAIPQRGPFFASGGSGSSHAPPKRDDRPVAQLTRLAKAWRTHLPHVRTSVVWSETSPAREILRQAQESEADFIAIATRRRGRLSRLIRPGVYDHLIRHAQTPVLAVTTAAGNAQSPEDRG